MTRGYSVLTGVGERITQTPGTAARFFTALHKAKVNVLGVAQNGERVICVLVESKNSTNGLRTLHSTFKLSSRSVSVGIITGRQFADSGAVVEAVRSLSSSKAGGKVAVCALLSREGMLLSGDDITGAQLSSQPTAVSPRDLAKFSRHVADSLAQHQIIIDLSDSVDTVEEYENWLLQGAHIITANSEAHRASPLVLRSGGGEIVFRQDIIGRVNFELSLGPLASFGRFLRHAALNDELSEIEFSASDSLSFIFNTLAAKGGSFSVAVKEALERGFLDPLNLAAELSGERALQHARNLHAFLGEESPFRELDISVTPLCEEFAKLSELSQTQVLQAVEKLDAEVAILVQEAANRGEILHFTARLEPETKACKISLKSYRTGESFGALRHCEKLLVVGDPQRSLSFSLLIFSSSLHCWSFFFFFFFFFFFYFFIFF